MIQVKIFEGTVNNYYNNLDDKVNEFLKENDGRINVKDIKYILDDHNYYSAMIIYETN